MRQVASGNGKPAVFIYETPRCMSDDMRKRLREDWAEIVKGTEFEGVPVAIFQGGTTMSLLREHMPDLPEMDGTQFKAMADAMNQVASNKPETGC